MLCEMTHWCGLMQELLCSVWTNNGGELPNHHCGDNAASLCKKGYCWCCCLAEPNKFCTRFCTTPVIFFEPISCLQPTLKRLFGEGLNHGPGRMWPISGPLGLNYCFGFFNGLTVTCLQTSTFHTYIMKPHYRKCCVLSSRSWDNWKQTWWNSKKQ